VTTPARGPTASEAGDPIRTAACAAPTRANWRFAKLRSDPDACLRDIATPQDIGNVAAAVLQYCHADGANRLGDLPPGPYSDHTGYRPVNTPDHIDDPKPLVVAHADMETP